MKDSQRIIACLAGVLALVAAGAAATQARAGAADEELAEVTVTGSRVITNGNAMPTPVTVVDVQELLAMRPTSIGEAIADLPTLTGSRITTSNPGTGVTNSSANSLNLRQLGYNRNLILFDGVRVPPTTYDQLIDTTIIPQMLLQRVDVVTGGVSAVYGSDAISGVVNFITDRNFNGIRGELNSGISAFGDDKNWQAGIAAGSRILGNKGHIEVSFQHLSDPGILHRSDRNWGRELRAMVGAGTNAVPYRIENNVRFSTYSFGGLISGATGAGAVLNGQHFLNNAVLTPFSAGTPSGTNNFSIGGDGAYHDGTAKALVDTNQFFTRFDYDFSNGTHAFVEGVYNRNRVDNKGAYQLMNALTFNGQNAFLPSQYQFTGTFRLSKFFQDAPRIETDSHQKQYFVIAGLEGKVFGNYRWDLNLIHSESQTNTRNPNNFNNEKFFGALDAARDPAGNIVCRVNLTNPNRLPGCVPLNVFGPSATNAAGLAYVTQTTQFDVTNQMDDVNLSLSGSPFGTWAGPVNMALSGEWRNQSLQVDSNTLPSDLVNCTGGLLNCTATTQLWRGATLDSLQEVSMSVYEGAVEADVPLVADKHLFKNLSLNLAGRYTNYSTSGVVYSWKAGLSWNLTDTFRIRGAQSRDIRAPTLYDLYQPASVNNNGNVTDLLTGITQITPVVSGGNKDLFPETARTSTLGLVYEPSWAQGLSMSVDGYYIDISNAIITFNPTLPGQTNCYQSGGTSLICTLITRPFPITNTTPANTATQWRVATLNISNFITYGIDTEVSWRGRLFNRPLGLRALVTHQPHVVTNTPGQAPIDNGGGAQVSLGGGPAWPQPKLRASLTANYTIGQLDVNLQQRWRSDMLYQPGTTNVFAPKTGLASQAYTDLNLRYRVNRGGIGELGFSLSIRNLFNTQPQPFAGNAQIGNHGLFGGFPLGDDAIGRYYNLGVRFRR